MISRADKASELAEARTMGMVTLALFFLFFSTEVPQWLSCTVVAVSIVVAAEIREAALRRAAARTVRTCASIAVR